MSWTPCIYWPGCGAMVEGGCADCPAEVEDDDLGDYEDDLGDYEDDESSEAVLNIGYQQLTE
jgi:hypothetical protein